MTQEKAKHLAEVLNAYAEGKTIEVLLDDEWGEANLDEYSFDERESYRIKKEPKYRPFKNAKECFDEIQRHHPIGGCIGITFLYTSLKLDLDVLHLAIALILSRKQFIKDSPSLMVNHLELKNIK